MSRSSNCDVMESDEGAEGKRSVPSMKTPFDHEKLKVKKEDE